MTGGKKKQKLLRARMEKKRRRIIEYLQKRESDEIISDIGMFWTEMEAFNQ